jgi:hypothetical protein
VNQDVDKGHELGPLPDECRERIRAEELYREEVRKALKPVPGRAARLWEAMNAPFTLWLCSGLFISAATGVYTRWADSRKELRAQERELRALTTEFNYRLDRTREMLKAAYGPQGGFVGNVARAQAILELGADQEGAGDVYSIPQYKGITTISILFQVEALAHSVSGKTEARSTREQIIDWCSKDIDTIDQQRARDLEESLQTISGLEAIE